MSYAPFDLTDKSVLITGGNGGIGLGMAHALASAGANLAILGRNKDKNDAAAEQLSGYGRRVWASVCDVGDEAAVEQAFGLAISEMSRIDACFANAGVSNDPSIDSFTNISADEWRRVLRVNLDGVFFTLRAAARHMIRQGGGGSLVVISSVAAISGQARGEHYAATKGAVIPMMRGLAVELARYGIRSNAILPGWVETSMTNSLFNSTKFVDRVLPRVPARRWGRPDDFGGIAIYLVSDASSYHTGDTFLIDGGYSAF